MKKTLFYSITILIVALVMSACTESRLKFEIAKMNSKCPVEMSGMTSLDEVTLEDNTVIFKYSMSETKMQEIDAVPNFDFAKLLTKSVLIGLKSSNEELLKLMMDANVTVKTIVATQSGSKEYVGEFSTEEITELMNSEDQGADAILHTFIETVNELLPEDLGDGLTQIEMQYDDNYLIYKYEIDEQQLTINEIKNEVDAIKLSFMETLKTNPDALGGENIMKAVEKADRGLKFIYEGKTSKETVEVTISNFELMALMN